MVPKSYPCNLFVLFLAQFLSSGPHWYTRKVGTRLYILKKKENLFTSLYFLTYLTQYSCGMKSINIEKVLIFWLSFFFVRVANCLVISNWESPFKIKNPKQNKNVIQRVLLFLWLWCRRFKALASSGWELRGLQLNMITNEPFPAQK